MVREEASTHTGNLLRALPEDRTREAFEALLEHAHLRLERIVSFGQATPAGEWLRQERTEWVLLLAGRAALRFKGEAAPRVLGPGDYVRIAPHAEHRVEWTATDEPTIWLALHYR